MTPEIYPLSEDDSDAVFDVINAAAEKYRGEIPTESDTDPDMPMAELTERWPKCGFFWVRETDTPRRHRRPGGQRCYPDPPSLRRPEVQRQGIGSTLLEAGIDRAGKSTILVGTWKAATWAIDFYETHDFEPLGSAIDLLDRYWEVPEYQMDALVVLRYDPAE